MNEFKYITSEIRKAGLSIISVVLFLLILSLLLAVGVTIITTQSSIGLQEELGARAFYIAEAGIHYALENGVYSTYGAGMCNYVVPERAFAGGSFFAQSIFANAVSSPYPAKLSGGHTAVQTTIYLSNTPKVGFTNDGYTLPGTIRIDDEYVFCSAAVSNTFTGCVRGYSVSNAIEHDDGAFATQCSVRSTGAISSGLSFGSIKRVVQVTAGEVL